MTTATRIVLIFFAFVIACCLAVIAYKSLYNELFLSQDCWEKVQTEGDEYSGIIKRKFIDYDNHGTKAISIENDGNIYLQHFPYDEQYSIWDKIQIGDSISKERNSLNYFLKRGVKTDTIPVVFNCKDNLH